MPEDPAGSRVATVEVWPWVDARDRMACARALEGLLATGGIEGGEAAWLSRALDQACGGGGAGAPLGGAGRGAGRSAGGAAGGDVSIPWASWAARICERAGLGDAAMHVAVAAAAVAASGLAGGPDDVARWCVAGRVIGRVAGPARAQEWLLCAGARAAAAAPENPPVDGRAVDGRAVEGRPGQAPGARELVALWGAPALLAGEPIAPWCRFAERVAEPVWVLDGLARLWLAPGAPDVERAALTPLLALWLRAPELAPALLRAYAGERGSPSRRFEIHSLVARAPYRAELARAAGSMLEAARDALPRGSRLEAAAAELLDALADRFRFFDELMAVRDLLSLSRESEREPAPPAPRSLARATEDLGAAIELLVEGAPWRGSWEVQRFGVCGSPERPVGQWFVRGTILQALLEVGRDVRADVAALLGEIPAGGLRYYGAWPGIAPDADDLGLMLQLAAAAGAPPGRVETWIAFLLANVGPDGAAPTWFFRSPDGTAHASALGGGDACPAVRLNLLAGLLSFDPARFDALIQENARLVLAAVGPDRVDGLRYYDAAYAALAFHRFARLYRARAVDRRLEGPIAALEAALRERAAASQRLDGGWGSPQRTAAHLEGAATAAAPDVLLLERGARYLGELQRADGSWAAEPLYLIPMKADREGWHGGRALTTALCARALGAATAALSLSRSGGEGRPG